MPTASPARLFAAFAPVSAAAVLAFVYFVSRLPYDATAIGTVTRLEAQRPGADTEPPLTQGKSDYLAHIRFATAAGRDVEVVHDRAQSPWRDFRAGDRVEVNYDSSDPRRFALPPPDEFRQLLGPAALAWLLVNGAFGAGVTRLTNRTESKTASAIFTSAITVQLTSPSATASTASFSNSGPRITKARAAPGTVASRTKVHRSPLRQRARMACRTVVEERPRRSRWRPTVTLLVPAAAVQMSAPLLFTGPGTPTDSRFSIVAIVQPAGSGLRRRNGRGACGDAATEMDSAAHVSAASTK